MTGKTLKYHKEKILNAYKVIRENLEFTPLRYYPNLSDKLSNTVYIKHENFNIAGSFKIRGAFNFIHAKKDLLKGKTIITATRGNHGISSSFVCNKYSIPCTIVVPHNNNPEKNSLIKSFGAELKIHGRDFDDSLNYCLNKSKNNDGLFYLDTGNEYSLIYGAATYSLEIIKQLNNIDYIFVPIGSGTGISGALLSMLCFSPNIKIIGVQAKNADSVYQSYKKNRIVSLKNADTIADGLATRNIFANTFAIIKEYVHDIIEVSEKEIIDSLRFAIKNTHTIMEPASAVVIEGLRKSGIRNKKVVLVFTGANIDSKLLGRIFNER